MTHVELIKPSERISPDLDGTGYLPPSKPATLPELAAAIRAGQIVWKVARVSVNWRRAAKTRLLRFDRLRVRCIVLGGTKEWYFVQVEQDHLY